MTRTATCDGCGMVFPIKPNHPAWEIDRWCPACFATVFDVVDMEWIPVNRRPDGMRAEDV